MKHPEATRTAAEDDGHAVNHGLVEIAEAEARLLFPVKVGKQVEAFVERDEFKFLSPDDRPELPQAPVRVDGELDFLNGSVRGIDFDGSH